MPPSSPSSLPPFTQTALDDLLVQVLARPGEVHVVVAPPGAGKSTGLRALIADRMTRAAGPAHVLWATQGIHGDASLGAEAQQDFKRLGVNTSIVLRREEVAGGPASGAFERQFDWPAERHVKVISHRRVGQIFGHGHPHAPRLATADLLVIDEDPFSSLTLQASATTNPNVSVAALAATGSTVGQVLGDLERIFELVETPDIFRDLRRKVTGASLHGHRFWTWFHQLHPDPVDVPDLARALAACHLDLPERVAQTFAHDAAAALHDPGSPPHRFGLDWTGPHQHGAFLRFDLLPALTFPLPVLVLDGYADPAYYRAMFPGRTVHLHAFDPGAPLTVECAPMLKLHEVNEHSRRMTQNRKQIAEELALLCRAAQEAPEPRRVLALTSSRLADQDSEWSTFVREAAGPLGLDTDHLSSGYWHAGRGENRYAGADVIALHRPHLNRRVTDHTLAALFPQDASERQRLRRHLEGAEALQMLHRGRQTTSGPANRPRVILAASEEDARYLLEPFLDRVSLQPYTPHLRFTRGSQKPRWRDALLDLAPHLLDLFPHGVPRALLQALPMHDGKGKRKALIRERLEHLAAGLDPSNPLHQAMCAPQTWRYANVPAGGSGNGSEIEKDAMQSLGLHVVRTRGQGTQGAQTYYLRDTAGSEAAMQAFNRWLDTGERPARAPDAEATGPDSATHAAPSRMPPTLSGSPEDVLLAGLRALRRS